MMIKFKRLLDNVDNMKKVFSSNKEEFINLIVNKKAFGYVNEIFIKFEKYFLKKIKDFELK
jgi:hypothetical protein